MKIVEFRGGLGNQLFEYAHYLYLKNKYPNTVFWGFYPGRELWMHNGLEIQKHFEVELPNSSVITNLIGWILFTINRKLFLPYKIRMPLVSSDLFEKEEAILNEGYWQNRKYYSSNFRFEYKVININIRTLEVLKKIRLENSVSVHVRRGDYLTCDHPEEYSGICTPEYYRKAIELIKSKVEKPVFYFFSDDPDFVKENFFEENMIVVDWNRGTDSYLDMFLMSNCKALILANSTFSYWGAQNNKLNPIVCCPTRWNNNMNPPNITMPGWIEIES